ncbi:MAG: hypothetical protein KAG14_00275 [Mycoplasmataceae bacterium]|nr:hypothetical protein [Mycoplasmataceae bacterium]
MFKKQLTPKKMVIYAVYTAVILFMTLTPNIGFIKVGTFEVSTLLIPIVIATAHLGFSGAIFTSTLFGLMAFILGMTIYTGPAFIGVDENVGYWFIVSFLSRLGMGILLGISYIIFKKIFKDNAYSGKNIFKRSIFWLLLTLSIVGQLSNTTLFVGLWIALSGIHLGILAIISLNLIIEFSIVILIPLSMGHLVVYLRKSDDTKDKW